MTAEISHWWRVTNQIWVLLLIGWSKFLTNHKHYPDLVSVVSLVWNFIGGGYRVFLKCDTVDAEIFYSTNGSYPVDCNMEVLVKQITFFNRISLRKELTFCDNNTGFLVKWHPMNDCRNFTLMTCHYPDLVLLLIGWSKFLTNHKHYPDLVSVVSLVWNFIGGDFLSSGWREFFALSTKNDPCHVNWKIISNW